MERTETRTNKTIKRQQNKSKKGTSNKTEKTTTKENTRNAYCKSKK